MRELQLDALHKSGMLCKVGYSASILEGEQTQLVGSGSGEAYFDHACNLLADMGACVCHDMSHRSSVHFHL
jgi:hypothetical protein